MKRTIALLVLVMVAAECSLFQESSQQRAERIEPMLSAAGFRMLPADTPEKLADLKTLTPLKLRYFTHDGKLQYWFADPTVCTCLYIGDEAAYQSYQQYVVQERAQEQAAQSAQMEAQALQQEQLNFLMWPYGSPYPFWGPPWPPPPPPPAPPTPPPTRTPLPSPTFTLSPMSTPSRPTATPRAPIVPRPLPPLPPPRTPPKSGEPGRVLRNP